ncbi:hypothetical protein [Thiomicrorhabdus aquaedulcis]|uniref:hypothetical protein n=1 Tax=Thiomicrorhabdus aquaedulcis TaxID=2211106 RepID=UPI000FD94C84|nr:hypothetical protein [Thiomicrorhabdus aquaedulcis]
MQSTNELTPQDWAFLQADYLISRRLRAQLAHLFGYDVPSCLRDILLQAQPSEVAVWFKVEHTLFALQFKHQPLSRLADTGYDEHQIAQACEAGRQFAGQASAEALLENGIAIRNQNNPYQVQPLVSDLLDEQQVQFNVQLKQAWSDGFMAYLDMLRGESW